MTVDEILARESIRQTIADYTIAGDSRDPTLFLDLWSKDALFEFDDFPPLPGFRHQGVEAIRARAATWTPLPVKDPKLRSATFVRHNLTTCRIEFDGTDTAKARTYFIVMTDIGPDHSGTYTDRLVRESDRWRFAHRRIELNWRAAKSCFPPVPR